MGESRIPRGETAVARFEIGKEKYSLTHDDTVINEYSEDYEYMNNIVHRKVGKQALIIFNKPDLISVLEAHQFPIMLRLYPTDEVVDLYMMYQEQTLSSELEELG